jgi:hypothetical protein
MTKETAFLATDFNWVRSQQSIWSDPPADVGTLNQDHVDGILTEFSRLDAPSEDGAIGRAAAYGRNAGGSFCLILLASRISGVQPV